MVFPSAWKIARICPIPKTKEAKCNDDYRPISILPVLSKVYERLVLRQMAAFLYKDNSIFKDSVSAYRKEHTTTSVLLAIKDEERRSWLYMRRGEVTTAVLADYSKAFDTVDYGVLLKKLHRLGFSKSYLSWLSSYLTGRKQFVQINDKISQEVDTSFGVPQGSILGPVLFNLYINDLSDGLNQVTSHQYADDTSLYTHGKRAEIDRCQNQLQSAMDHMSSWSNECNLTWNPEKTKVMLFSTPQLARTHTLSEHSVNLTTNGQTLERVSSIRLLGNELEENLKWNKEINSKIHSCYGCLSVLRKLKNLAPFKIRKQLAETLILSRIDYNDAVSNPIPDYLIKRLQRVQLAAAGFVMGHFADVADILNLGWLPIAERRDFNLSKLIFKALHEKQWPSYLTLEMYTPNRTLRSSSEHNLTVPLEEGTFQACCAKVYNNLPEEIKLCDSKNIFNGLAKTFFRDIAAERLSA
jgi:hypothetical protein